MSRYHRVFGARNPDDEDCYMSEACAYFALALHELHGYPLRILVDEGIVEDGTPTVAHDASWPAPGGTEDIDRHQAQRQHASRYHSASAAIQSPDGIFVYHGSAESGLSELKGGSPPYEGGIGAGVYVGLRRKTALFYGDNIYVLRTKFGWGDVLVLTPEAWRPVDGAEGHSVLVGEHVPPFTFESGGKTWTVGGEWVADIAEAPETLGELIDLDDIGAVAREAGYRAVFLEGVRYGSSVNEEMLVFDDDDLEMLDESPGESESVYPPARPPAVAVPRTAWSRDTLEFGTMCSDCGSDLDIAGRAGGEDDPLCKACWERRETPPTPQEPPKKWWQRWKAAASALDHGPTFRDWQTKARRTIQDAFSGVEEDDESDWLAIAKSALAATLPHVMYRGFSVPAADAVEAERLGAAAMRSTRRAAPHSFSKAVARSFAVGVEPFWAAGGSVSDTGMKHRDKAGQWGVIVSVSVGPDMVDWSCIDDGGGIFGEQVYDHLPFDKPVGEAIAAELVESGGTHNAEWDLRVKPYPLKSANIEVFQIAPGDTGETEAQWREWETRGAASAKSKTALRAAADIAAEIEAIATEVRRRAVGARELEGDPPKTLCLGFARELADELTRRGYAAGVTQGTFEVDQPEGEAYTEWDPDDFEGETDEDRRDAMGRAMRFPLHYWVRVTAKGGESVGPVYADITADQFDDECDESFDPVWVWTGDTGRHQAERHDFSGLVAGLRYHHAHRMIAGCRL